MPSVTFVTSGSSRRLVLEGRASLGCGSRHRMLSEAGREAIVARVCGSRPVVGMRLWLLVLMGLVAFPLLAMPAPTVSCDEIDDTSNPSPSGWYIIGDVLTIQWDNTAASGDGPQTVSWVTVDFSDFGGPVDTAASVVSGTANDGIWEASYTIAKGTIHDEWADVHVTASDGAQATGTMCWDLRVDNEPPEVEHIWRDTPCCSPTAESVVEFEVVFSEAVESVGTGDFAVDATGGQTTATVSDVNWSGGDDERVVEVTTVDDAYGTVSIDITDPTGIRDRAGNDLAAPYTDGESFTVDREDPWVESILRQDPAGSPTNAVEVTFRVTFNEDVTSWGASWTDQFELTKAGTATGIVDDTARVSDSVRDVTITGITGDGTLSLGIASPNDLRDDLDNEMADDPTIVTEQTYTIDNTAPQIDSILRRGGAREVTRGSGGFFRVTFDEGVENVSHADFTATLGAVESVQRISPATYDLYVGGIDQDGVLDLGIAGANDIDDLAGNALGAAPAIGAEETYTVDLREPYAGPPINVLPSGAAGDGAILDAAPPLTGDGHPTFYGDTLLQGVYAIGEPITGSCALVDDRERAIIGSYVRIYLYEVNLGTTPDVYRLMHFQTIFDAPVRGTYPFAIETGDLMPGYYDVFLRFVDESSVHLRVRLVEGAVGRQGNGVLRFGGDEGTDDTPQRPAQNDPPPKQPPIGAGEIAVIILPEGRIDSGVILIDGSVPNGAGPPAMAGLLPLAGTYPVGTPVRGACLLVDVAGTPYTLSSIHVFVYAVTILPTLERFTLLDHWGVDADPATEEYRFEIPTAALNPGIYDIHVTFPGGGSQRLRIELI